MAVELADLYVLLRANTSQFSASLVKAGEEAEGFSAKMQSSLKSGVQSLAAVGVLGTAAVVAFGVKSVDAYTKFAAQMTQIRTQAGASAAEVANMTKAVYAIGPAVGYGPLQLAQALYHIESVGIHGAKAAQVLRIAAEGAQVGQANLVDVTNALDAAVVSGIQGVQNYSQAMGALNAIVGSGDMTTQDLADALGTGILASAKVAGVSLQSVGAALATFGDNNIRGSKAAVYLRQVLSYMVAPSGAAATALAKIGLSSTAMGEELRRPDGLVGALQLLQSHLKKSGLDAVQQAAVIADAFGKSRGSTSVEILLTQLSRLQQKYGQIGTGATGFGSAWQTTMGTLRFQVDQVRARFETWETELGQKLAPVVVKILEELNRFSDWCQKHTQTVREFAIGVGVVLAGGLLAAAYAAASLAAPFLLVGGLLFAVGAGVAYAYDHFAAFREIVRAVGRDAVVVFHALLAASVPVFHALIAAGEACWRAIGAVITWFTNGPLAFIKGELKIFQQFWAAHGQALMELAKIAWDLISAYIVTAWKVVMDFLRPALVLLQTVFKVAWDVVSIVVKTAWDVIAEIIRTVTHVVLDTIGLFADLLTGRWSKLWGDLKKLVSDAISGVLKIVGTLAKGALTLLFQAGKDLVQGFVNGIKAMASAPVKAVKDMAHGAISAAKSALSVLSPSRVFHDIGVNVSQGLANGITARSKTAVDAAKDTAAKVLAAARKAVTGEQDTLAAILSAGSKSETALRSSSATSPLALGSNLAKLATQMTQAAVDYRSAVTLQQQVDKDPQATASQRTRAAAQVTASEKLAATLDKLRATIEKDQTSAVQKRINAGQSALGATSTADSHLTSTLSAFIKANQGILGASYTASASYAADLKALTAQLAKANTAQQQIDRTAGASAAEKTRAATQAATAAKQLAALEKLRVPVEQMAANNKTLADTVGVYVASRHRRGSTRDAVARELPSYLSDAVSAGVVGNAPTGTYTSRPAHHAGTATVNVSLMVDGKKLADIVQKHTLAYERRNSSNGLSRRNNR